MTMKKKLFTIALALCMILTMVPGGVSHSEVAWAASGDNVGIYLRTRLVNNQTLADALKDNDVQLSETQLSALGLNGNGTSKNGYYDIDKYGYWVDYASFSSKHVVSYNKTTQKRGSDEVKNVVNEIASSTVTKKSGITFDNLHAITWDTLSWSPNSSGSDSWHLNGEVRLCEITFDLNYGDSSTPPSIDKQYAVYNTALKTGWPKTPTREGYEFNGWYTKQTTSAEDSSVTEGTTFVKNTTLYAQWSAIAPATRVVTIAGKELNATNKYYHNGTNGAAGTADNNSTGANATFDSKTGTLTLHNLDVTTAGKGIQWEYSPDGAHDLIITLDEGTDNKVISTADGAIGSYRGDNPTGFGPSLTIQGKGILEATGANNASGIWAWKNITIKGNVTVYAAGGENGIANNSKIGMITIQDHAKVIANGGTYGIGYSNGYANVPEIKGGALVVSGGTAAMMKAPVIDGSFDNIRGGTSQDGTDAVKITESGINDTNIGTYRYLKIVKGHTHCICGETHQAAGDHKRIELVEFQPHNNGTALPATKGNYYLDSNVSIAETWVPKDGTILCLNGKTISADASSESDSNAGNSAISISKASNKFTLTDCTGKGILSRGSSSNQKFTTGIDVYAKCEFALYGGGIQNFKMTGVSNYPSSAGVGTFKMYGGTISGNTRENNKKDMLGVGVYAMGNLYICGDAKIIGNSVNSASTVKENNIGLTGSNKIVLIGNLSENAEIGVNTSITPTKDKPVVIAEAGNGADVNLAACVNQFKSDDPQYEVARQDNTLVLKVKENPTIQYTVTFDPSGGSVTSTTATTNAAGKLESLPTPTREGYTFNGWYTKQTGGMKIMEDHVFEGNATIYAQWIENSTENTFTVTFDPSSGSVTPTTATTNTAGKLESFPTPTRDGFTFVGWYTAATGGEKIENSYIFTDNATIYAQWTKNGSSGGSGSGGGYYTPSSAVTTSGSTSGKVTSSPTEVKRETKTDANGSSVTTATVTVSAANQREILRQAKANKSGEIVIKISQNDVKDAAKIALQLEKSFIEAVVTDTDAKLIIQTPDGERTFTQDELKKLAAEATDKIVTVDPAEAEQAQPEQPADTLTPAQEKLVKGVENTNIDLRSQRTPGGNILLTWAKEKGYKVDYFEIYRSTKRSGGYGRKPFFRTPNGNWTKYLNTKNIKEGSTYYYKIRGVRIIDGKKYYTEYSTKAWRSVK